MRLLIAKNLLLQTCFKKLANFKQNSIFVHDARWKQ